MRKVIFHLALLFSMLVSFYSLAEQEPQDFSDAELAQMLAPIALYPDSLLTHILIASTYPIEVVEAHRWLKKNGNLKTNKKRKLLTNIDWDASVKALIPFERVLSRLSDDLSWTRALGDAFLQDESRLLLSIQKLRKQAKLAGSLNKMNNVDIDYQDNNISIVSRTKEVVYVPYYDSRMVYGSWFWSAYPPVYWHPRRSVYVSHHRPFYWHSGVHITFNYFFSAFHWHNRHVVVVKPHRVHYRYYHQRPRKLIAHGGYAKRWSHQSSHRKGVAYRTQRTSEKYYGKRIGTHRVNKHLNNHHNVKKRLYAHNSSSHKVNHKLKHISNNKVKHKNSHKAKHVATQQKLRSTDTRRHKSSHRIDKSIKRHKSNSHVASSVRKGHYRAHKATSHQARVTKNHHGNKMKDRR